MVANLASLKLAFLHIMEGAIGGARDPMLGEQPFDLSRAGLNSSQLTPTGAGECITMRLNNCS